MSKGKSSYPFLLSRIHTSASLTLANWMSFLSNGLCIFVCRFFALMVILLVLMIFFGGVRSMEVRSTLKLNPVDIPNCGLGVKPTRVGDSFWCTNGFVPSQRIFLGLLNKCSGGRTSQ